MTSKSFGLFEIICHYLPLNPKKIVFSNFLGRGWGDNPKYIAEEILRREYDYDLVWLVSGPAVEIPDKVRKVTIYSRRSRYELSTARIIISNVKTGLPYTKKKGQYYLQTWHGDFPLKYIEQEAESNLGPFYVNNSKADSAITDIILSGNHFFSDIVRRSFWYTGEILEKGLPRNDIFFKDNHHIANAIRIKYGISHDTPIALFAPTFRSGDSIPPSLDWDHVRSVLQAKSGKDWTVFIRLHTLDHAKPLSFINSDKVIDVSDYPDTQELEVCADLLITDYSSMMYDFALQQKPVILYIPDIDDYMLDRGLRPLFFRLPFPSCKTEAELSDCLEIAFSNQNRANVNSFLKNEIQPVDTGNASAAVVDRIHRIIELHD